MDAPLFQNNDEGDVDERALVISATRYYCVRLTFCQQSFGPLVVPDQEETTEETGEATLASYSGDTTGAVVGGKLIITLRLSTYFEAEDACRVSLLQS